MKAKMYPCIGYCENCQFYYECPGSSYVQGKDDFDLIYEDKENE